MTSEGLGEMFEGDSADTLAEIFSLVSMGGRAEGLPCADLGARTPISVSGIPIFPVILLLSVQRQQREDCPHIWQLVAVPPSFM